MKIGLFGNSNNAMYFIAEGLHLLGQEAVLIVTSKELLDRPESYEPVFRSGYPDWIIDTSELQEEDYFDLSPNLEPVIHELSSCDALLLNSVGPSLLQTLDGPAIVFLTGSDLEYYANPKMIEARTQSCSRDFIESVEGQRQIRTMADFIQRQRQGIQTAIGVRYFPRGLVPAGDELLDELGVRDDKRFFLGAVDHRIKWVPAPHNQPVRVFCATRLTWKLPIDVGRSSLDYKGSDIMIRGLAQFYRATGTRLDIQLVRKGLHVRDLEILIGEQGLADQVTWSDEMSLIELQDRFAKSDIVIEQLGGSIVGGAGIRAMAVGRPVIGNAHPEMFEAPSGEPDPICRAKTPEEVCSHLKRLVFDPNERERIGRAARQYVMQHYTNLAAAQFCIWRFEKALRSKEYRDQTPGMRRPRAAGSLLASVGTPPPAAAQSCRPAAVADLSPDAQPGAPHAWPAIMLPTAWITGEGGSCFACRLEIAEPWDSVDHPAASVVRLYEDSVMLGPPHASLEEIRRSGGGCYSHWEGRLYFSSSDDSDPRLNGRRYEVRAPVWTLRLHDERLREAQVQISERVERLRETRSQIRERDERLREAQAQISERDERLREAQAQISSLIANANEGLGEARSQIIDVQSQLIQANERSHQAHSQVTELRKTLDETQFYTRKLEETIARLRARSLKGFLRRLSGKLFYRAATKHGPRP
jgi:hypothetical protein